MLHKIAHLARLEIRPEEEAELTASLGTVLDWMQQLTGADTAGVEPLTHLNMNQNVWREDTPINDFPLEEALEMAPGKSGSFLTVPRVIE